LVPKGTYAMQDAHLPPGADVDSEMEVAQRGTEKAHLRGSREAAPSANQLVDDVRTFLVSCRIIGSEDQIETRVLAGGVSSDIHLVLTSGGALVVKRALPQLKVEGIWLAPVERSTHEAAYLRVAEKLDPGFCPRLLAHDPESGYLAMEYLDPENHPLWKTQLLTGRVDVEVAGSVGDHVGRIHAAAAAAPHLADQFDTTAEFRSLRIHPYLETLQSRYPNLSDDLDALIGMLLDNRHTLIHGDVSPKNILVGVQGPVLLDAECAWWGDPAFDLAFCANHLLLKSFLPIDRTRTLVQSVLTLRDRYVPHVGWEEPDAVAARTAALLPALMLARVDGLSPVEYFDTEHKDAVRTFALDLLGRDGLTLDAIAHARLDRTA